MHEKTAYLSPVNKDETPLQAARRYVREGEKHVAMQTAIRDELKARGEDTAQVEKALDAAIAFLRQAREHLVNEAERSKD